MWRKVLPLLEGAYLHEKSKSGGWIPGLITGGKSAPGQQLLSRAGDNFKHTHVLSPSFAVVVNRWKFPTVYKLL